MSARRLGAALLWLAAAGCAASRPAPGPGPVSAAGDELESVPLADSAWIFPIAGGVLPAEEDLMPNAAREYRGGVHQGVDLYGLEGGATLPCATPVRTARSGWVVRADQEWAQMFPREYDRLTGALKSGPNEDYLDRLRGRQVWIRSADGVICRYCHLGSVVPELAVGVRVAAGVVLGKVGNSGTSDGARGTGKNCHLHFEIWPAEGEWLGKDLSPRRALAAYAALFHPAP